MSTPVSKADRLIKKGNVEEAENILQSAAEAGDIEAAFRLGTFYEGGVFERNSKKAWLWFEIADRGGHPKAPFFLGSIAAGRGEDEIAHKWFVRSAERAYLVAMARLGYNYRHGKGIQKSTDMALKYYEKAMLKGSIYGYAAYSRMLIFGHRGFVGRLVGVIEILKSLAEACRIFKYRCMGFRRLRLPAEPFEDFIERFAISHVFLLTEQFEWANFK